MSNVPACPTPAKQAGVGTTTSTDLGPVRAHLATVHRALDDLHLVAEDAISAAPRFTLEAQRLDIDRHGTEATEQLRAARELVEAMPGAGLEPLCVALRLAAATLASLCAELELPALALRQDIRHLTRTLRQQLAAADVALDPPREREGRCTVLPDLAPLALLRKGARHEP